MLLWNTLIILLLAFSPGKKIYIRKTIFINFLEIVKFLSYNFKLYHYHLGSKSSSIPRILNGYDSMVLPYQVKLSSCGGTIIDLSWVLTARHCVGTDLKDGDFMPSPQTVWAGISNLNNKSQGQYRDVPTSSIIVHDSAGMYISKISLKSKTNKNSTICCE